MRTLLRLVGLREYELLRMGTISNVDKLSNEEGEEEEKKKLLSSVEEDDEEEEDEFLSDWDNSSNEEEEEEEKEEEVEEEEKEDKLQLKTDQDILMEIEEASNTSMDGLQVEFSNDKYEEQEKNYRINQRRIIDELMGTTMKEGDTCYVLSMRWYEDWRQYTGDGDEVDWTRFGFRTKPGKIDNHHLIEVSLPPSNRRNREYYYHPWNRRNYKMARQDPEIRHRLKEGFDFIFVPRQVWKMLHKWYKGGPALPRLVKIDSNGKLFVDYQLVHIRAFSSYGRSFPIMISRKASIRELYEKACTHLSLDQSKVQIWVCRSGIRKGYAVDISGQLEEVHFSGCPEIYVETIDDMEKLDDEEDFRLRKFGLGIYSREVGPDIYSRGFYGFGPDIYSRGFGEFGPDIYPRGFHPGFYPRRCRSDCNHDTMPQHIVVLDDEADTSWTIKQGESRKLQGLKNLGNTCFMNSAIQCLVNTSPIAEYFMQDFDADINKTNPLGKNGELAVLFSVLLRRLWSSEGALKPSAFKRKLDDFAPQFSGSYQHDSHEFLAFLLDGLHEDLNRVKEKPYIERKDSNDRPDTEVATEYWENHKARNDSVIVDVFQGQDKSTLACPVCGKVSVTFDPFMYLSVPLPKPVKREMTVTVFHCDGSAPPKKYPLNVPRNGCCKDLIESLSTACCLSNDETLYLAEVHEHKIKRYLSDKSEQLSKINDNDVIVAYIIPSIQESSMKLEIIHTKKPKSIMEDRTSTYWGTPLVTYLTNPPESRSDVLATVRTVLRSLLKTPVCNNQDSLASTENNHNACEVQNMENEVMDCEEISDWDLTYNLCLEGNKTETMIDISHLMPGEINKVELHWSERLAEPYDESCLTDVPTVHKPKVKEEISLFSCLDALLNEEPLGLNDMWYCSTCKENRQATKKLDLWRLPEILCIQLKRFSSEISLNKVKTLVNFPIQGLDLTKYVKSEDSSQNQLYDLYAIINHCGGLSRGHYTTYAKVTSLRPEGETEVWYNFDDSSVNVVEESKITTTGAYILFYKRVSSPLTIGSTTMLYSNQRDEQENVEHDEQENVE